MRKGRIWAAAALLCVVLGGCAMGEATGTNTVAGNQALSEGEYEEALALFQKGIIIVAHAALCTVMLFSVCLKEIRERLSRILPAVDVFDESRRLLFRIAVDLVHATSF